MLKEVALSRKRLVGIALLLLSVATTGNLLVDHIVVSSYGLFSLLNGKLGSFI